MTAALRALYDGLPSLDCKQLCQASCHDVPVLTAERDSLGDLGQDRCPRLDDAGQCTVHDARPLMCRLWGVVENMRCPYGCEPSRLLSMPEARALLVAGERAGGRWLNTPDA